MDSTGVHVLVDTLRRLEPQNRRLAIVCREGGQVHRLLALVGLLDTLSVYGSRESAVVGGGDRLRSEPGRNSRPSDTRALTETPPSISPASDRMLTEVAPGTAPSPDRFGTKWVGRRLERYPAAPARTSRLQPTSWRSNGRHDHGDARLCAPDRRRASRHAPLARRDLAARDELSNPLHALRPQARGPLHAQPRALDDLVQIASIGLLNAIDRFDPDQRQEVHDVRRADDPGRDQALLSRQGMADSRPARSPRTSAGRSAVTPSGCQSSCVVPRPLSSSPTRSTARSSKQSRRSTPARTTS